MAAMDTDEGPSALDRVAERQALQRAFTEAVHRNHRELCSRGMEPNQACALALRAAAGQVPMPRRLSDMYQALERAAAGGVYDDACSMVRSFFSSTDALLACFWPRQPAAGQQQDQQQQQEQQAGSGGATASGEGAGAGAAAAADPRPPWLRIDAGAVRELHDRLQACDSERLRDALLDGCQHLVLHIADCASRGVDNPGFCRQVCAVLANPWLHDVECHRLVSGLAGVLVEACKPRGGAAPLAAAPARAELGLGQQLDALVDSWDAEEMRRVVSVLHQCIAVTLYHEQLITAGVEAATALLGVVEASNARRAAAAASGHHQAAAGDAALQHQQPQQQQQQQQQPDPQRQRQRLEMDVFYNDAVNEPDFDIKQDYKRWTSGQQQFSFCAHPWIYDPASKSRILQLDNHVQQLAAFEATMMRALMGGAREACPFLVLKVRRGPCLLQDTLLQINSAKNNGSLKKPLKVKFVGEEGVDEGGLQKEFFQLLVRQCFNPEFGMFVYSEETRLHWFHASSMDLGTEFELIGILIGLAIYNSHILEFHFPMVLYKKLLGHPVSPGDLAELHPEVHRSLERLKAMAPDELEALEMTWQVEEEAGFGERAAVELCPGGASRRVDADNVAEFAAAYARRLLDDSIKQQFGAFRRGFLRLCSGRALQLFRPAELEQLVCGGREVDLTALEAATQYDGGFTADSKQVCWFWEVVHKLNDAQQRRLLCFITGSDRVPIRGLGHLSPPFVIIPNGDDCARLPTAHTCFNHLLLPTYQDKETLRVRLLLAIENAEGFGLL